MRRLAAFAAASALTVAGLLGCAEAPTRAERAASPQWHGDRFENTTPIAPQGFWRSLQLGLAFIFRKPDGAFPSTAPFAVAPLTRQALEAAPDGSIYRLGHSTVLLKLRGRFWLTDPVFSRRAFPVQWAGPSRFHAPPIALDALPPIAAVILSHDHYDHLDHDTVTALAAKTEHFLAPLGVGDHLVRWGIDPAKVRQLDWWQSVELHGVRFTATPARHFSGRGLGDANHSLWAAWAIDDGTRKLFFGGDSGYFDGFRTIGERLGPFDVTLLDCGAYDARWAEVHMHPQEVVQAHRDLRGRWLLPIHNGTFDLGLHPWKEPLERITDLGRRTGVRVATPAIGERFDPASEEAGTPWWKGIE